MEYLRSDTVFMGPLSKIEALLKQNLQLGEGKGKEDMAESVERKDSSRRLRAVKVKAAKYSLSPGHFK